MPRLIDADALMEHVYRDRLDSRELIAEMVRNAPAIEPGPRWIPCAKSLPPSGTACFVTVECNGEKSTCISTFDHGIGWSNLEYGERVVSWMKLPDAYYGWEDLS